MRQASDTTEPTAATQDDAASPPADQPGAAATPSRRRKHWSRWTWMAATILFFAGTAASYLLGSRASSLDVGITVGLVYLLAMTSVLAALAALSVKHRSGVPATVAALFVIAVLTVPTFLVAGAVGVRDRAVTALENVLGGGFGADSVTTGAKGDLGDSGGDPGDVGETGDDTLTADEVIELEGDGDPLTDESSIDSPQTFGDDAELDALWTQCENGNFDACGDLYMSSPIGSEYEEFALTCGGRAPADSGCAALDED